ncbi:unnamed protein product [Caenorhabditis angaria]|uniref:Uncharacterized protein n=1 Tax=Caenorhabditis angaria TaxID=860376 RepID=A0A9P1I9W6_9PELO|nr:unnamed protein product [Caenorhabditis angaria]
MNALAFASVGGRFNLAVKKFRLDLWAKETLGIEFLRIPPYHCFLNAFDFSVSFEMHISTFFVIFGISREKIAEKEARDIAIAQQSYQISSDEEDEDEDENDNT